MAGSSVLRSLPHTWPYASLPSGDSSVKLFYNKLVNICLSWAPTLLYSQNNPPWWSLCSTVLSYSLFLLQLQCPPLCGLFSQLLLMDICPVSSFFTTEIELQRITKKRKREREFQDGNSRAVNEGRARLHTGPWVTVQPCAHGSSPTPWRFPLSFFEISHITRF